MKRRCRDCTWWRVRKGCVHPAELARTKATAIRPDNYQIYKHTECDGFTWKERGGQCQISN